MMIVQSLLQIIKRPLIALLLIVQMILVLIQLRGMLVAYDEVKLEQHLMSSLTSSGDTVITINAQTPKEELEANQPRDTKDIEHFLEQKEVVYNKVYVTGGQLSEQDYPAIIDIESKYQYNVDIRNTEALIVTQSLQGEPTFIDGDNFTEMDFANPEIYPVILGSSYQQKHAVGDIFEIDMSTGGGLGKMKLKVKGFLEDSVLQPILSNYVSFSTLKFTNYFIIGMTPKQHSVFNAPSYIVKGDEQLLQDVEHFVYQLPENRYVIMDQFSHKKLRAATVNEKLGNLVTEFLFYVVIIILTYYTLSRQQYQLHKKEYAILALVGATKRFNVGSLYLSYLILLVIASVGVYSYMWFTKIPLTDLAIIQAIGIYGMLLGVSLAPVAKAIAQISMYQSMKGDI